MSRGALSSIRWVQIARVTLLAAGLALGAVVAAQPGAGKGANGPAWSTLSPAQQAALAPLKRDWPEIDSERKQKWLDIAARFPAMPADERERVQARMTAWSRMSPEERGRARLQFQEARQISPQQRQSRWDAYMALPESERRALARSAGTVPKASKADTKPDAGGTAAGDGRPAQDGNPGKPATAKAEPKAVAPTLVQAKPGASTTLISNTAKPPAHAKAGEPKIATGQGQVDRSTLLPQTGPQRATAARPSPSASTGR